MSSETAELACTYAALILADEKVPVTADKINALLKAANVTVAPFWPGLFARVLEKRDVEELILSSGSGPAAPAAAATSAAPAQAAEKKEEKKKEEKKKSESDDNMGFGLFD
jgi:large subunit ribosomal protein LP1